MLAYDRQSLPAPVFNFDMLCVKSVVEIDLTSPWNYQCGPWNGIRFLALWALAPSFPNTVPPQKMGLFAQTFVADLSPIQVVEVTLGHLWPISCVMIHSARGPSGW